MAHCGRTVRGASVARWLGRHLTTQPCAEQSRSVQRWAVLLHAAPDRKDNRSVARFIEHVVDVIAGSRTERSSNVAHDRGHVLDANAFTATKLADDVRDLLREQPRSCDAICCPPLVRRADLSECLALELDFQPVSPSSARTSSASTVWPSRALRTAASKTRSSSARSSSDISS